MDAFCTIITSDYLPYARVLFSSLRKQNINASFHALVVSHENRLPHDEAFEVEYAEDLLDSEIAKRIYQKYAGTNTDHFRWALKPVYLTWLLHKGYQKVIFTDPDIYFVDDPGFLLNELDTAAVILTPHWSNINPMTFEDGLFSLMRNGLFNAGFIGASTKGLAALQWWAEVCHYKIEKAPELGLYDDQKYLDLLPVEFENVTIIKHRGCNLAYWNLDTNIRELKNGKLQIRGNFNPVFIHFAQGTIENIRNGNDILLKPWLEQYLSELEKEGLKGIVPIKKESVFYYLKRKTLLRTRFKRLLFRLAGKL